MTELDKIKAKLLAKKKAPSKLRGLSCGSSLGNIACTGDPAIAWPMGSYCLFVGDSNSGKSFLALASLAEACRNKDFANYRLIYDGPEYGAKEQLLVKFGGKLKARLEARHSRTVEEFYYSLDEDCDRNKPFVRVLDSMDVLTVGADDKKFQKQKKAFLAGKEEKGSYGMGKARLNSDNLRKFLMPLQEKGSILIIINQTRSDIGFFAMPGQKTHSGGLSLGFYADIEMWSSIRKRIKRKVRDKDRHIGNLCKLTVKRSRITGREASCEVPIFWSSGIDDVGSMVEWLIEEKHWKRKEGKIIAEEFDFRGSLDTVVRAIEEPGSVLGTESGPGREKELRDIVAEVWHDIQSECEVARKPRYV